jgi:bifunctional non-homologous end joining protein LigD
VAKRLGSKYKPGRTSPDWIKIKNFEHREVVIGGWITHRDGTHGILVGDRDGDKLASAGVVDIGVGPKLIGVLVSDAGSGIMLRSRVHAGLRR